jgi:molybdopterin converting factor subunit 1
MNVTVRLFAILRERAGSDRIELELPEGARVADALAAVDDLAGGLSLVMAVNREYAAADQPLEAGDELALIPPVSGGATTAPHVAIREDALSLDALVARVRDPRAGAVVTFSGVTRAVPSLEYEAYAEMALEQMRAIVAEAIERHGLCAAAAEHRVGTVPLSEASVIVAVSAPHRPEAFEGGREIIDRLKELAPIWKQEVDEDGGATWVAGTPPPAAQA